MKHSIRKQLMALIAAVLAAALLLIGIVNYFFLGHYYERDKIGTIEAQFRTINAMSWEGGREAYAESLEQLASAANLQILITDTGFDPLFSTVQFAPDMQARLFGYYTGLYQDDVSKLREKAHYTVQRTAGEDGVRYLELWGELDNGCFILIRTPLASIKESTRISNRFYVLVGVLVIAGALLAIWLLSMRFTKPIEQLTDISRRMAKLDFTAKYHVRSRRNEIDELGQHMNEMSGALESTITELKSANLELTKDIEKKTEIDRMRVEFLNNVSHELKTPIALIQGYAEGLREGIAEDEESRQYYCDVIIDESQKMNRLVMQLLSLNRIESGNEKLELEQFDIVGLIHGVLQGMDLMLKQQNAAVYFPYHHPEYVWGDKFKIEEVFTNYMSNALHHLDYERKIDIQITKEGNIRRISVFNTGNRIPEEDLPKIWDKFYKVDKARTRAYGGTGIGLSIVKAIMEAHGQKCGAENFENGVAFYFTLEGRD